jgi:hypothetical protein
MLFWRQLLTLLGDRRVIPIVGPDAVVVEADGGPMPYEQYLARRVAERLEIVLAEPPARPTLHDVACRFATMGGSFADVYSEVKSVLDERAVPIPAALRKLARIGAFRLYVTTTFDDLLQRAIDAERFGGRPRTQAFAYAPERVQDLPAPVAQLHDPVVYHLLGRASPMPDYVVTEEDMLEFVHSLQSENRRPNLLLDELSSHSLLVIGSGYSGWLARFFLRTAKRERLLLARSKTDVLVDARVRGDTELTQFLRHFSAQTKIFPGGAIEFIDELAARWEEQADKRQKDQETEGVPNIVEPEEVEEDAIFVSYASEDAATANALVKALRAAGLPVWLDKAGGLQGGENYEAKIRMRIESASLFVPLLSTNVLTPQRRFFRVEWMHAFEVAKRGVLTFIVPVRTGDVSPSSPLLPEEIRELHWLDARDGAFDETVQRLKTLYREYRLAMRGA